MKKAALFILAFLFVSPLFIITTCVHANEAELPFEITPVIPENQAIADKGYFDLRVTPNSKHTIYIQMRNLKDHPITLLVTPFNASTSSNGEILYDVNAKTDKFIRLQIPLAKFITYEKKVIIPAKGSLIVPFVISLPDVNEGTVLGGIHVIAENEPISNQEIKQGESTFQIKNQIAYVIGMKMQFPIDVEPDFSFGNVKADLKNGKPKLVIEMKNSAAAVIKDLSGKYTINDKDGKQIWRGFFSNMQMAPNTRFEYAVNWKDDAKLAPGTYTVKLSAKINGKEISAQRKFTIKETERIKDHNETVKKKANEKAIPWWNYVITAAIAGLVFFLIGRSSKKNGKKNAKNE
jgi:hypothetical protein